MTSRMCPRCKCCSIDSSRWAAEGTCVGHCEVNGHTIESIDAARQAEYERQLPIRAELRRRRAAANYEVDEELRELDALVDRAGLER